MRQATTPRQRDDSRPVGPPAPEHVLERLLRALIDTTGPGSEMTWEVDDAHVDSYCLAGAGWLVATRSIDGDGIAPFAIVVADADGVPIIEVTSSSPFGRRFTEQFTRLHAAAGATARLSDALGMLTDMVTELEAERRPSDQVS